MGLETATTIEELNENWPLGSDTLTDGDGHLRLIKSVLKAELAAGRIGGNTGQVFWWAGATAPDGALQCLGQELAQATYPDLYAIVGDTWATTGGAPAPGAGNFRLPPSELNGRAIYVQAQTGTSAVGDAVAQAFPEHDHTIDHNHPSRTSTSAGAHKHDLWMGDDDSGAANSKVLEIREPQAGEYQDANDHTDGSPPAVVRDWMTTTGGHTHDVDIPNFTGTSGNAGSGTDTVPESVVMMMCIWAGASV
jgi:microcystin-dependent protein